MQLKRKALFGTVALALMSGQALADIKPGSVTSVAPGTSSELVFWAYGLNGDGQAATYVKDLGSDYTTFKTTPAYAPTSLAADSNWTSFMAATVTGDRQWGVFAVNRTTGSPNAAGTYQILTTAASDNPDLAGLVNTNLINAHSRINNGIAAINGIGTDYATNSSYFYNFGVGGDANLGDFLQNNYNGATFGAVNTFATQYANFYNFARGTGTASATPTVLDIDASDAKWSFNGTTLQYGTVAAIPEPETYGMLIAGLLLLGAVARRRRS